MSKFFPLNRTWIAGALTAAALAAPLAAWWVAGSRAVRYRKSQLEEQAATDARALAERLAGRLAQRLESLRDLESHRPFFHYQNLFHDPRSAVRGNSVSPSPLGAGPGDPLIRAYFQLNADGRITLPTLNEEIPSLNSADARARQKPILEELKAAGDALTLALPKPPESGDEAPPDAAEKPQLEIIARNAWIQNQKANQVFLDLRRKTSAPADAVPACVTAPDSSGATLCPVATPAPPPAEKVYIHIGEFHWRTVPLGGVPALLALRQVRTPDGLTTQGFQLDLAAVKNWLQDATPAKLDLRADAVLDAARLPVAGADWFITVAPDPASAKAAEAAALILRFHRTFAFGTLGALFSGFLMVLLVRVSERTALQRSRFAAAAAHELRTPLAGLRMYGEMLSEGLGDPAKSKDYARWIAGEADRLGRVVANVLEFTRLERGKLAVKPMAGDLAAALRDFIARIQPSLTAAGVKLDLSIADNLPAVPFDRDALSQIVYNLVDNAEKYSRNAADRSIWVTLAPGGRGALLCVTDHGPGIPAAQRRRLFRPFSRGKGADLPAGLGLGLTIVQALIKAHGGKVAYESADDGGAIFRVEFPT